MIGKSLPELIFIRVSIILLRSIPWISVLYTAYRLANSRSSSYLRIPQAFEYWLYSESFFYLFVFLPRRRFLQKPTVHPPLASRAQREVLFDKCLAYLPDKERFTSTWFRAVSTEDVKRENYTDWILWALFSTDLSGYQNIKTPETEAELDGYLQKIERLFGRKLEDGRNDTVKPLLLTLDPVVVISRPLVWYLIVATVDLFTYIILYNTGLRHYTPNLWIRLFPPRIQTFFSRRSPTQYIPYWYRPHRSSTRPPIVMLHGIGIGLWPYTPFLAEIQSSDPDVGILALEILPISMRITYSMISEDKFIAELKSILDSHGFEEFVLLSHSYGSVLTTHILRSCLAPRVVSIMLIDPVTLLLHLADVAFNFVYRAPITANHWQLWYFASRDMGVSHSLSRHFFWEKNILWKEDFQGKKVGVSLSGRDQITDTKEIWRYLTNQAEPNLSWKNEMENLSVLWFPGLDHSQVFDTRQERGQLLELLRQLS